MHESDKTYNRVMWCGFAVGIALLMARATGIVTVTVKHDGSEVPAIAAEVPVSAVKAPDFIFQAPSQGSGTVCADYLLRIESGSEDGLAEAKTLIEETLRLTETTAIRGIFAKGYGGTDSPAEPLSGMPKSDSTPTDWWYFMDERGVAPLYPVLKKRKVENARNSTQGR